MDKDNDDIKKRQKIIEKCIDMSYEFRNKLSVSVFGWKNKLFNFKDSMKYNLVNMNIKFIPENSSIHLLYKTYNPNEAKGKEYYDKALNKFLLFTYRSNYKEQTNVKNNTKYNSDCGWGCMIRSSQMIFSRMIYKIFKYIYKEKGYSSEIIIKSIIPFFMDDNIFTSNLKRNSNNYINIGLDSYIQQLNIFLKEKIKANEYKDSYIKSFDPPFSIHKICIIGEIFGRTCGEWFSDFELPKIYEIINSTFNILPNLCIMHYNSEIDMYSVIEKCFEKIENTENLNEKDYFVNEQKEKYIFRRMGAIFISVRLGISTISSDYFSSIKKLFECKQFLGFIGGKINSASYFFGFCNDDLLYLDPHFNQESNTDLNNLNFITYLNKTVYKLPLNSLQCAFTVGFLFRNLNEFRHLYLFLKYFTADEFACFHVHFKPYEMNNNQIQDENNNENDDF